MDEAVSLARSVCAASADIICFCLLPVVHGSTTQQVVVKHRRHVEDLMMAHRGCREWINFGMFE